jgi:hypothetical protein
MNQFEYHMNFLGIKQVQMIIFTLKIQFHNHLSILCVLWTGSTILKSAGTSRQRFLRLRIIQRRTAG